MHILISDDSPVTLKFLQKVLESLGHQVTLCTNGLEAWEKMKEDASPKLCIIDWDMPAMSGLEVCKSVRAAELNKYIIFLTAKDDALDIEEGLKAGADDYICKPFRQEELEIRLRAAIRILSLEKSLNIPHNKLIQAKL